MKIEKKRWIIIVYDVNKNKIKYLAYNTNPYKEHMGYYFTDSIESAVKGANKTTAKWMRKEYKQKIRLENMIPDDYYSPEELKIVEATYAYEFDENGWD